MFRIFVCNIYLKNILRMKKMEDIWKKYDKIEIGHYEDVLQKNIILNTK